MNFEFVQISLIMKLQVLEIGSLLYCHFLTVMSRVAEIQREHFPRYISLQMFCLRSMYVSVPFIPAEKTGVQFFYNRRLPL